MKESTRRQERIQELAPLVDEYRVLVMQQQTEDEAAKAEALAGQCFKYENSYGVSDPDPQWFVYRLVLGRGRDGYGMRVLSFQDDKRGRITITIETASIMSHGWQPITRKEFTAARRRMKTAALKVLRSDAKPERAREKPPFGKAPDASGAKER